MEPAIKSNFASPKPMSKYRRDQEEKALEEARLQLSDCLVPLNQYLVKSSWALQTCH